MFRNVPACSGMFHVPDFIDGRFLSTNALLYPKIKEKIKSRLKLNYNINFRLDCQNIVT